MDTVQRVGPSYRTGGFCDEGYCLFLLVLDGTGYSDPNRWNIDTVTDRSANVVTLQNNSWVLDKQNEDTL